MLTRIALFFRLLLLLPSSRGFLNKGRGFLYERHQPRLSAFFAKKSSEAQATQLLELSPGVIAGNETVVDSISLFLYPSNGSVLTRCIAPERIQLRQGDLRCTDTLTAGQAIRGLYDAFNDRNATAAASFLDDDCVYEDLLLGPNTICRGKEAFTSVLKFHPAFVTSALFSQLPFAANLPVLRLIVDSVAEGVETVGVEWHVEIGSSPFPLGRGLSQAKINPATGKILRVVDIAEAPWRVIGLLFAPLASVFVVFSEINIFRR
mmetsp:Transcript_37384/g.63675  ORF Transcript_37384/g.63675 Transcript_37384/m.63675 type:complete len:263 (+) Transcript_37384:108-896(+)